jgi:uncharacterized protein YbjT (DUF2867 family)
VRSVFLLWPFLTADGAAEVVDRIARHAQHVVHLSATAVRDGRPPEENGVWGAVEHLIERSGLRWTFLRAGGLAANALGWADQIRSEGVVRWPYGAAARSLIHERDVAAVAVRALTEPGHASARHVLTGPAAITQADQVRTIGEVIGRPVRWEETDPEVARGQLLAALGDPDFVDGALAYWASLADAPEAVTGTVEEITGAPACTFRQWPRIMPRTSVPGGRWRTSRRPMSARRYRQFRGRVGDHDPHAPADPWCGHQRARNGRAHCPLRAGSPWNGRAHCAVAGVPTCRGKPPTRRPLVVGKTRDKCRSHALRDGTARALELAEEPPGAGRGDAVAGGLGGREARPEQVGRAVRVAAPQHDLAEHLQAAAGTAVVADAPQHRDALPEQALGGVELAGLPGDPGQPEHGVCPVVPRTRGVRHPQALLEPGLGVGQPRCGVQRPVRHGVQRVRQPGQVADAAEPRGATIGVAHRGVQVGGRQRESLQG